MAAIKTINLPYRCVETSVTHMNGRARGAADAVLYGADGSLESAAMADVLNEMGVEFEYRSVSLDPAARREWEDLDGESIPMLRLGNMGIVRGLDRIKVQQLFGWVAFPPRVDVPGDAPLKERLLGLTGRDPYAA